MRVRAAAGAALLPLFLAACGGGSSSGSTAGEAATLEQLAGAAGDQIGLVPGSKDFAPGPVRFSFLMIDEHGKPVERPSARIWLARGRDAVPFLRTSARLESIEVPGGSDSEEGHTHLDADARGLYVLRARIDKPGTLWVLARPDGVANVAGLGTFVVEPKAASPAIGTRAPASATPVLGSAPIGRLTTRKPPDRALLRYSVAESLRQHVPFVVSFATPAFCASRTCGPVVDIVDHVRQRLSKRGVRFIHVEIYEDNKPAKGVNRWVREWNLPSEPWTFLVGRDGRIKDKFEGALSASELEQAVRRTLLQ
ncbi:MAG: hypothetical protein ACXWZP_03155 [Gaiellaceae bacterium]